MVDSSQLEPQYQDFKALEDSTVIHIRGLKLQLEVAYATLKRAIEKRKTTKEPEETTQCESTKTEGKD